MSSSLWWWPGEVSLPCPLMTCNFSSIKSLVKYSQRRKSIPIIHVFVLQVYIRCETNDRSFGGKKIKAEKESPFRRKCGGTSMQQQRIQRKGKSLVSRMMSSSEEMRTSGKHMNASGTNLVEFQTLAKLPSNRASWYSSMLKYHNQIRDKRKYF